MKNQNLIWINLLLLLELLAIGYHLSKKLLEEGINVIIDNLNDYYNVNLKEKD